MAFGIAMSGDNFPDTPNPLLLVLFGLLAFAVVSQIGSLVYANRPTPRHIRRSALLAACALASAGLIVATFAAEVLSAIVLP